jgi:Tol biopolymer transport system component
VRSTRLLVPLVLILAATLGVGTAHAAFPVAKNGRIVFERDVNGKSHVFVMNADGSNPQDLSPADTLGDFNPQFSPNGRWILFGRGLDPPGTFHTFVMRSNGTGAVDLTPSLQGALGATFTPDGKRIVFGMDIAPALNAGLYTTAIMNADGSGVMDLTPGNSDFETFADISPDGSKIVFQRDVTSNSLIYMVNPDGTGLQQLTQGNVADRSPAFSPAGSRLAWTRDPNTLDSTSGYDVFTGDTTLGGATNITPNSGHQYNNAPVFSPDTSKIAYTGQTAALGSEILLVGAGGGPITGLSQTADPKDYAPHWEYIYMCGKRRATIVGGDEPDVLKGTKKPDVIVGNGGDDRIKGKGGNDRICGGLGRDHLIGGAGPRDRLIGGPGKDKIKQ